MGYHYVFEILDRTVTKMKEEGDSGALDLGKFIGLIALQSKDGYCPKEFGNDERGLVLKRLALLHYDDTMVFLSKGENTIRFDASKLRGIDYETVVELSRTFFLNSAFIQKSSTEIAKEYKSKGSSAEKILSDRGMHRKSTYKSIFSIAEEVADIFLDKFKSNKVDDEEFYNLGIEFIELALDPFKESIGIYHYSNGLRKKLVIKDEYPSLFAWSFNGMYPFENFDDDRALTALKRDILNQLRFDYDVALSFAGEDRELAERLADGLKTTGLSVFYDKYEKADLWGKDLYQHLQKIYRDKSRFCVILISKHYAEKLWTKHELKQAQERAFKENSEYILPVRLDYTEIPGINDTTGYISIEETSAQEIVELIHAKLKKTNVR